MSLQPVCCCPRSPEIEIEDSRRVRHASDPAELRFDGLYQLQQFGCGPIGATDATALTNQGWSERGTGSLRYHPDAPDTRTRAFHRRERCSQRLHAADRPYRCRDSRRAQPKSPAASTPATA